MTVPSNRVATLNDAPVVASGRFVLYWMTAFRRRHFNHALERAADHARELHLPLIVFEPLRCDYPWASERLHSFVVDGMRDNVEAFADGVATYIPYVERSRGEGRGLLEALARDAAVVVTDDYPCFFHPRMLHAAASKLPVRLEAIDSNGLMPVRLSTKVFARAHDFRRFVHRHARDALGGAPAPDPLGGASLPPLEAAALAGLRERWPLHLERMELEELPIDHTVTATEERGGPTSARKQLAGFMAGRFARYAEGRNHPDDDTASGLSPWLHFGHISTWEVLDGIAKEEGWEPDMLPSRPTGKREGWWKMSAAAEAFVDELVTWRELGFSTSALDPAYDRYDSLPSWAQQTLADHQNDPKTLYSPEDLEAAKTSDEIWNAAQRQLVGEGRVHNYLRMLWGKRILEWTATPQDALEVMVHLNNKYALDGRDPNSYSGIFWVLGRYDRPWGPERPVFGKVRYMSSDNTRRKLHLKGYLGRWADPDSRSPEQLSLA